MKIAIVMTSQDLFLPRELKDILESWGQPIVHHAAPRQQYHQNEELNRCVNIALGRTEALRIARRLNPDWYLFMDTDVIPPQHALTTLLQKQKSVVGGWIKARCGEFYIGGRWYTNNCFNHFKCTQPSLTDTDLISLGCTLVRADLLAKRRVFDPGINTFCRIMAAEGIYNIADSGAFSRDMLERGVLLYLDGEVICRHLPCEGFEQKTEHVCNLQILR